MTTDKKNAGNPPGPLKLPWLVKEEEQKQKSALADKGRIAALLGVEVDTDG